METEPIGPGFENEEDSDQIPSKLTSSSTALQQDAESLLPVTDKEPWILDTLI